METAASDRWSPPATRSRSAGTPGSQRESRLGIKKPFQYLIITLGPNQFWASYLNNVILITSYFFQSNSVTF